VEDCCDIVIAVECTFIVLCRKLYEETERDEVGEYVCSQITMLVNMIKIWMMLGSWSSW